MPIPSRAGSRAARGLLLIGLCLCLYVGHVGRSQERPVRLNAEPWRSQLSSKELLGRGSPNLRRAPLDRSDLAHRTKKGEASSNEANGLSTLSGGSVSGTSSVRSIESDTEAPEEVEPPEVSTETEQSTLPPSAFELQLRDYVDPLLGIAVEQFGYEMFQRDSAQSTDLAVADDYVLGVGDEVVISVWGQAVDNDFTVTIDRQGEVRLPDVGLVTLNGLRIADAESLLTKKFREDYRNFELRLRLAKIRDIEVHVVGRVSRPGRLNVPSIATLLDVLAAAGGVKKDGSLRQVVLRRRGEQPRPVDLYAYLLEGDLSVDLSLRPGDAIVVPAVGPRVAIVGRVLRPAIYEIGETDRSFEQLLAMAGGYGRLADRQKVQLESEAGGVLSVRTIDLEQTRPTDIEVSDGDVLVVREALPKIENVVYVVGNVARPGRYAFRPGMKVADVLTGDALVDAGFWLSRLPPRGEVEFGQRVFSSAEDEGEPSEVAGAKIDTETLVRERQFDRATERQKRPDPFAEYPEPFLEYALIRRIDPQTRQERRLAFHLGRAVLEQDPSENRTLESQDTIVVFPRESFELERTVHVSGAVNVPGDHKFYAGMRVLDLVRMAGGLLPEAFLEKAVLTRVHAEQSGARFENIEIDLREVTQGSPEANLVLRPDDSIAVRIIPDYKRPYRVVVEGEVRQPGVYTVVPGERLSALIERAGGFTNEAYLPAAEFYRAAVRRLQEERLSASLQRLETDTKLAAQRFTSESQALGEEVNVVEEQQRIEQLIETIRATPATGRMVVRIRESDELVGKPDDVELQDGDLLRVPRRPEEVHVVGAVFNQTALLYKDGLKVRDYLTECGGPMDTADMSIAYVIRSDGTADSAEHARRGYRWDAERGRYHRGDLDSMVLYPGDTIVVPYDVKPQLSNLGLTKTVTQVLFQAALATGVVVALL